MNNIFPPALINGKLVFFVDGGFFGDGSAAAPSVAFASAPTTGFFLSGGQISLTFGGARYLGFTAGSRIYGYGGTEYIEIGGTGPGNIDLVAGGTNQNVTLKPSGTGHAVVANPGTNPSYIDLGVSGSSQGYLNILGGTSVAAQHSWQLGMDAFSGINGFFFYDATRGAYCGKIAAATGNWLFGSGTPDSANGLIQLATHTTSAGGIGFGADVNLYRSSADVLKTDDTISAAFVVSPGYILSSSATLGIGYSAGAGGTVTQITSRATGVTLNKVSGAITLFNAAGSATAATFTVTNSAVAATDTVQLSVKSGTNVYIAVVSAVAAGSFNITFWTTGGTAADSPVINFTVIKAVTA